MSLNFPLLLVIAVFVCGLLALLDLLILAPRRRAAIASYQGSVSQPDGVVIEKLGKEPLLRLFVNGESIAEKLVGSEPGTLGSAELYKEKLGVAEHLIRKEMTPNAFLDRLERQLGYTFKDQELMVLALTHRSFAGRNNERLEFLGDAILNFVAGEALFDRFPLAREGQLSRLRARLVKGETLAVLARGFDLGEYLRLGSGELKSGGFRRESILADALEALIGAIYLDAGMEVARERVLAWLAGEFEGLTLVDTNKDPKTRLQEFLQSRGCELPRYEVVDIQ
eukprot:gene19208-19093_t